MERDEYLKKCKREALALLGQGRIMEAVTQMLADMSKRDDTRPHPAITHLGMLAIANHDERDARRVIEGFR